jgi:hypothetical protein
MAERTARTSARSSAPDPPSDTGRERPLARSMPGAAPRVREGRTKSLDFRSGDRGHLHLPLMSQQSLTQSDGFVQV